MIFCQEEMECINLTSRCGAIKPGNLLSISASQCEKASSGVAPSSNFPRRYDKALLNSPANASSVLSGKLANRTSWKNIDWLNNDALTSTIALCKEFTLSSKRYISSSFNSFILASVYIRELISLNIDSLLLSFILEKIYHRGDFVNTKWENR